MTIDLVDIAQGCVFTLHLATRPPFGISDSSQLDFVILLTARIPFWVSFAHPF